ncbi:MAG: UbiA prenyltransferase family protein [Armatimonadetes bacterium]|nr:UbiA prenyltransferase family protein [Armatimonadota bacterium]
MMALLAAMRPRQWTKNLLVFAGLTFAGRFAEPDAIWLIATLFAAFCFVSSAGYLLNDIVDRPGDVSHPEKRLRPIASGKVSTQTAAAASAVLLVAGFAIPLLMGIPYGAQLLTVYAANQVFYMTVARRVAILDVFVISIGFLVRAVAGAAALRVSISPWLLVCTFLLALFLGFAKRKHEYDLGANARASLSGYTAQLLDQFIMISAAAAALSYSVYAIESHTATAHPMLVLTIPFPIFGIFRYLQLVYKDNGGGNPDQALVKDPWMYGTILLWAVLSLCAVSTEGWVTP